MIKRITFVLLVSILFVGCSLGTANVYKVSSKQEMLSKKANKKISKEEPLEKVTYSWTKTNYIDFRKYCNGKPAKHWAFYQKASVWGFNNKLIVKFVCEEA